MRPRNLLILALVVAAMGTYLWFFERGKPSPTERRATEQRLLSWQPEAVTALEIVSAKQAEPLRLERRRNSAAADGQEGPVHWQLHRSTPSADAVTAETEAVEALVEAALRLTPQRTEAQFDAPALGLQPPRLELRLETADGSATLRFGDPLPVSRQVPLVLLKSVDEAAGPVHQVDPFLLALLERPADAWRARALLPGNSYQVARVRLLPPSPTPPLELERRGLRDLFQVSGGGLAQPDAADSQRVGELLAELEGLRVERFLDGPRSQEPVAPSRASVEVHFRGRAEPFRLSLEMLPSQEGEVRGESDAGHFTLRSSLPALLGLPVEAWRSLDLTQLEPLEIAAVAYRNDRDAAWLERIDGSWRRDGAEVSALAVATLLDILTESRTRSLLPETQVAALPEPVLTLTLRSTAAPPGTAGEEQHLTFHRLGDTVAVAASNRTAVLRWTPKDLERLREQLVSL